MRRRGLEVILPKLADSPASTDPLWKQHADSVARSFAGISHNLPVILVAHSGAGPLLPVIRQSIPNPIHAYVFVDAGLPKNGATRLDLMKSEDAEWARQFEADLERGGHFPDWSFEDLEEVIPDESLCRQMVAEIRPREASFFAEHIPVFEGWPDAPCVYIKFSAPYEKPAAQAQEAGWPIHRMESGHFHMLVDAPAVATIIVNAANKLV
jgi:hypothetical protein